MTCIKNNQTHFENQQDYTTLCEVCNLYVKVYKFRSCEVRHQKLAEQGVDVFKESKELDKIINFQTGQQATNSLSPPLSTSKKNPSRRGR